MTNTLRFNPFNDLPGTLKFFEDAFGTEPARANRPWTPAVDVLETEHDVVLKADLPGLEMKDIALSIENGTLTMKGERTFNNEEKGKGFHRLERSYGSFVRYFSLPETIDAEKVQAEYTHGVLTVTLPKKELAKPRSIKVALKN